MEMIKSLTIGYMLVIFDSLLFQIFRRFIIMTNTFG